MSPPTNTPDIFPFPPKKLVPPIIEAAIAYVSNPVAAAGSAAPTRPIRTIPAILEQIPDIIKTSNVWSLTLTPEYQAASLLPPSA